MSRYVLRGKKHKHKVLLKPSQKKLKTLYYPSFGSKYRAKGGLLSKQGENEILFDSFKQSKMAEVG